MHCKIINSTQNNVNNVEFLLVFFECWEDSSLHYEVPMPASRSKLPDFVTKKKTKKILGLVNKV